MEKATDVLMLKMNQAYSPWGHGGGGAPLRDNTGDTISDLSSIYNDMRQPVAVPLSPPQNSSDNDLIKNSYTDNNRLFKQNGSRVIQDALILRMEERHRSIREAFLASDRDRSGYLDGHEIKRLCTLYNLDTTQVDDILQRCDIDYNGMISYDEFCQTMVREDYPVHGGGTATSMALNNKTSSQMLTSSSSTNSLSAHRRQLRNGAISPTSLSPPFNVEMSHGRKSMGPGDDGNDPHDYGNIYNKNTSSGSGSGNSPTWNKNLKSSSPQRGAVNGKTGASFYVNAPETPERLLKERKRKKLINGLDSQVKERRKRQEMEQLDELRRTLVSQQRLIRQGLDYWGQPIPEGSVKCAF